MGFVSKFKTDRSALAKTILIYASFIGFYASLAIPGSSLLDLKIRIREPFYVTARIIPIHFTGYLMGAIGGKFFNLSFGLDYISTDFSWLRGELFKSLFCYIRLKRRLWHFHDPDPVDV